MWIEFDNKYLNLTHADRMNVHLHYGHAGKTTYQAVAWTHNRRFDIGPVRDTEAEAIADLDQIAKNVTVLGRCTSRYPISPEKVRESVRAFIDSQSAPHPIISQPIGNLPPDWPDSEGGEE